MEVIMSSKKSKKEFTEVTMRNGLNFKAEVSEDCEKIFGIPAGKKVFSEATGFIVKGILRNFSLEGTKKDYVVLEFIEGPFEGTCGLFEENLLEKGFMTSEMIKEKEKKIKESGEFVEKTTPSGDIILLDTSKKTCESLGFPSGKEVLTPFGHKVVIKGVGPVNPKTKVGEDVLWFAKKPTGELLFARDDVTGEKNLVKLGYKTREMIEEREKNLKKSGNFVKRKSVSGDKFLLDTSKETCEKFGYFPGEKIRFNTAKVAEEMDLPKEIAEIVEAIFPESGIKQLKSPTNVVGIAPSNPKTMTGQDCIWVESITDKEKVLVIPNEIVSAIEKI